MPPTLLVAGRLAIRRARSRGYSLGPSLRSGSGLQTQRQLEHGLDARTGEGCPLHDVARAGLRAGRQGWVEASEGDVSVGGHTDIDPGMDANRHAVGARHGVAVASGHALRDALQRGGREVRSQRFGERFGKRFGERQRDGCERIRC